MPFPPPTHGHVERPIAETVDEYLRPKKSAIYPMKAGSDLKLKHISKGDALMIELGRNPPQGSVGLVDYEGEQFLAVWWRDRPNSAGSSKPTTAGRGHRGYDSGRGGKGAAQEPAAVIPIFPSIQCRV